MKRIRGVGPLIAAMALVVGALATIGLGSAVVRARATVVVQTGPAAVGRCSSLSAAAVPGASPALGFTAGTGAAPVWSGQRGLVEATSGKSGFSVEGECVVGFRLSDGHRQWSWHAGKRQPYIGGILAGDGLVVIATGSDVGTTPEAVFPVVNRLVALDANTGRQLWSRRLGNDGQSIPALFAGSHLVLSLAGGSVLGLEPRSGSTLWSDPPPASCRLGPFPAPNVNAAVVDGGTTVTVEYMCVTGGHPINPEDGLVAAVDPANGRTEWTWRPTSRWGLEYQSTVASSDGVTAVIGSPVSGSGESFTGIPNFDWDAAPSGIQTYEVVGVDQSDGRPLWALSNVPADAAVYAGRSQLCVVSQYGVSCRAARTGAESWVSGQAVSSAYGAKPGVANGVAAAGGFLYLVTPTPGSAPYTFQLDALSMANGTVTTTIRLPAFQSPNQVVGSPKSSPGVEAVSQGNVLVTPESEETDVTEVFKVG